METQIVGDVRANVLRVIAPRGEPNEIVHENFSNLYTALFDNPFEHHRSPFKRAQENPSHLKEASSRSRYIFGKKRMNDDFYLFLPSNASTDIYPQNNPSSFEIVLPNTYDLHGDDWQVALASIVYPTYMGNMGEGYTPESLFFARIGSPRRPKRFNLDIYGDEKWVPLHVGEGHYRNVKDVFEGMERALRFKFGKELSDREFAFTYEDNHPTITIRRPSVLAINPYLMRKLEIQQTFPDLSWTRRHFPQSGYDTDKFDSTFLVLGVDEQRKNTATVRTNFGWLPPSINRLHVFDDHLFSNHLHLFGYSGFPSRWRCACQYLTCGGTPR